MNKTFSYWEENEVPAIKYLAIFEDVKFLDTFNSDIKCIL